MPNWHNPRKVPPDRMDAGPNPLSTGVSKKPTRSVFAENQRENLAFRGLDGVDGGVGESEIQGVVVDHPNADVGLLSGRDAPRDRRPHRWSRAPGRSGSRL